MSSKSVTLISPQPDRTEAWVDSPTHALLVKIVNPSAGGGGGTEYDEDTPHSPPAAGPMVMAVRNDVAGSLVSADGDVTPLQVDSDGALRVNAAVSFPSSLTVAQATHDSLNVNANVQQGDADVGAANGLYVQPATGAAFPVTDNGGSLTVDGTLAVTQSGAWSVSVSNFPATQVVADGGGSLTVDGTLAVTQSGPWAVAADLRIGAADVDALNPVPIEPGTGAVFPVSDNGGSLTVDGTVAVSGVGGTVAVTQSGAWTVGATQATHDSLNVNANVQQGDADVAALNALYVQPGTGATFPVSDGGGSLTVDGTLAVTQSGSWTVTAAQATHDNLNANANVQQGNADVGVGNPLYVQPGAVFPVSDNGSSLTVDGTVAISGTVAVTQSGTWALGNLEKARDAASGSSDLGIMALAVRADSLAALAGTSGDYTPLQTDSQGRLRVVPVNGVASDFTCTIIQRDGLNGALLQSVVADYQNYSLATPLGNVPMAVTVETAEELPTLATDDYAPLRVDGRGLLWSHIYSGTAADDLGKAEDSAHVSGSTGVMALAVRSDSKTSLVDAVGDYHPLMVDSAGSLYVTANVSNTVTVSGSVSVTSVVPGAGATNLGKTEDSRHNSGDVGVMSLAVRSDAATALVDSDGDYSPLITDSRGRLWVRNDNFTTLALSASTRGRPIQITATASAGTLLHSTPGASEVERVYIDLSNTSAADVEVTIEYGTTGSASELTVTVPAKSTVPAIQGMSLGGGAFVDSIRAYASTGSVVNAVGRIERIPA